MGKFRQSLMDLPVLDMLVYLFLVDNLSKYQWIFAKVGMCIDIMEI